MNVNNTATNANWNIGSAWFYPLADLHRMPPCVIYTADG